MRVAVLQSCFIPWRGYFDIISSVDKFIIYDDVQYTPQNWRNRNRIKTSNGSIWITVPVKRAPLAQLICDTKIDPGARWRAKMGKTIEYSYRNCPYFREAYSEFMERINFNYSYLTDLNVALIHWGMEKLDIKTDLLDSRDFTLHGRSTERLIYLLEAVGADTYLSGPSASAYLDLDLFREAGINLEYKSYSYKPYPQPYGPFMPDASALDLIFNMGPGASEYIHSLIPDITVIGMNTQGKQAS